MVPFQEAKGNRVFFQEGQRLTRVSGGDQLVSAPQGFPEDVQSGGVKADGQQGG
jgi:hypothetical protein